MSVGEYIQRLVEIGTTAKDWKHSPAVFCLHPAANIPPD
jgi:hypothetical protein